MFWSKNKPISKEESREIRQNLVDMQEEVIKLRTMVNSLRGTFNRFKYGEKDIGENRESTDGFDELRKLNKLHPSTN